ENVPEANLLTTNGTPAADFRIQVCRGCNDSCTFCGDKTIVKNIRSKPLEACLKEFEKGLSLGYKNFMLIGDDVGAYGFDLGLNYLDLLNPIVHTHKDFQLRLMEINAKYLFEHIEYLPAIFSTGHINNIALAFQSGSDRILSMMARKPDRAGLVRLIKMIHEYGIGIHAHVLVGFPSETFADFKCSLEIVTSCHIKSCTFFRYSDRITAPAYYFKPKVTEKSKNERLEYAAAVLKGLNYSLVWREDKLQARAPSV
ncbi:radical SAM protein, partial [Candidatus Pacearchaeota archaeon]|nr:radical SAM protein [Candidatus Pacearchaeota archaeon]